MVRLVVDDVHFAVGERYEPLFFPVYGNGRQNGIADMLGIFERILHFPTAGNARAHAVIEHLRGEILRIVRFEFLPALAEILAGILHEFQTVFVVPVAYARLCAVLAVQRAAHGEKSHIQIEPVSDIESECRCFFLGAGNIRHFECEHGVHAC